MHRTLTFAFAGSLFASAFLLFLVQPIVAKLILPTLGSTPNVWNTCMVFFQAVLLAGYGYAHASIRFLPNRAQRIVHVVVLSAGVISLPITLGAVNPPEEPLGWMLLTLAGMVGLPFFALSATAPLFQAWFAQTDHPLRKNPYPLYAASNVGSILSLLSYPLVVDWVWDVETQSMSWSIGYAVFIAITAALVALTFKYTTPVERTHENKSLTATDRAQWVALAFVPSSLVLGSTTFISIDVGSIPLFWVIPLALYLLTFVIAFSTRPIPLDKVSIWAVPLIVASAITTFNIGLLPMVWMIILHMVALFVVALVLHTRLVRLAPNAAGLTEFYLWMSFGGVLGGVFNAIVAPTLLDGHYEYPIALAAAILFIPAPRKEQLHPALGAVGALAIVGSLVLDELPIGDAFVDPLFVVALFPTVMYLFRDQKLSRYGFSALVLASGVLLSSALHPFVIHQERSFFGTSAVQAHEYDGVLIHELRHGSTIHGLQEQRDGEPTPRSYFHREGPLGRVMDALHERTTTSNIAVIGLGAGTMAAYSRDEDVIDFYEIDHVVVEIARDPALFQYLSRARGEVNVFMGDGRLELEQRAAAQYDLLVTDAFSSDAIPTFLLTREAIEIYLTNLRPGGSLCFNVSNRHLDLVPILGRIARELNLHAAAYDFKAADTDSELEMSLGPASSTWVVLTQSLDEIHALEGEWQLTDGADAPLWTDAHHNALSAVR